MARLFAARCPAPRRSAPTTAQRRLWLATPGVQLAVLQCAALPLYDKPLGNEQRSAEAGVRERWDLRHVDAP
jgi:hypothetical protein